MLNSFKKNRNTIHKINKKNIRKFPGSYNNYKISQNNATLCNLLINNCVRKIFLWTAIELKIIHFIAFYF